MHPKQLERDGWSKMPSVTVRPGGAQHFYYRRNPATDEREWWLKIEGKWTHRTDDAFICPIHGAWPRCGCRPPRNHTKTEGEPCIP